MEGQLYGLINGLTVLGTMRLILKYCLFYYSMGLCLMRAHHTRRCLYINGLVERRMGPPLLLNFTTAQVRLHDWHLLLKAMYTILLHCGLLMSQPFILRPPV